MPGFDRSGPMGMGSMTGGARGVCNSKRRNPAGRNMDSQFRGGRGNQRGNRNMSGAQERSRRRRFNAMDFRDDYTDQPDDRDQEMGILKKQAAALKQELKVIGKRLQILESGE